MPSAASTVRILYATATGTAEDVAEGLAESLSAYNISVCSCDSIDHYQISSLPQHAADGQVFIFIVSTCGDGDFPKPMHKFWTFLRRLDLPATVLKQLRFAVFGLGDRAYVKFNAAARKLSLRLTDLGASTILPLGLGDESAMGGYDSEFMPWMQQLIAALQPSDVDRQSPKSVPLVQPRIQLTLEQQQTGAPHSLPSVHKWKRGQARLFTSSADMQLFEATVLTNSVLTNSRFLTDQREVRHVELDVSESPLSAGLRDYSPGDIIHVMPRNRPSAVDALFQLTGLDGTSTIDVQKASSVASRFSNYRMNITTPCSLRDFVASQLDLSAMPRRRFFGRLAPFATEPVEKEKLFYFASAEGAEDLIQYAYREKRTVLMVLRDFPSARPPLDHLIDMIPVLKSRPFSIASSSVAHHGKIQICAAIVRYTTPLRFARIGVCSEFFLGLGKGDIIPVFLEQGASLRFRHEKPAILIGPGTGVAPMRSFLFSTKLGGPENDLYFGCRSKEGDFLYRSDWEQLQSSGQLASFEIAFSRSDESKKVYVQDKMRQQNIRIWNLICEKGACVYIAGSAGSMPKDIRAALVEICKTQGELDETGAESFIRRMELSGRLQTECW